MTGRQTLVLAVIAVVVFVFLGVYAYHRVHFRKVGDPDIVTDVSRYTEIRSGWTGGLADHFPVKIPSEATDVRLSFYPGFLQGGAHFQVRMTLPPEMVAAIEKDVSSRATHRFCGGGGMSQHENEPNGVPTTFYYTSGTTEHAFPDSFLIYVLKATDAGVGFAWNRGSNAGIAISKITNTVVYWCESW